MSGCLAFERLTPARSQRFSLISHPGAQICERLRTSMAAPFSGGLPSADRTSNQARCGRSTSRRSAEPRSLIGPLQAARPQINQFARFAVVHPDREVDPLGQPRGGEFLAAQANKPHVVAADARGV